MSLVIELDSPYKKCTIKTTPGMSIQSIIEESCKQFQIEPKGYSLLFKKQLIEPSLPIRLANIPHGSKLSLVFKGSKPIQKVTIALQTESDRYIDKANSNLSLFDLLLHFEQNYCLSIVKREEGGVYMMPVCVFMNREYTTIEGLKGTSLVDIGLTSGNGAIKVFGRACDKPLSNYLPLIESSGPKAVVEPVIINNLLSDTTKTQPDSKVAVLDDSTPIPKNTLKDVILPDRHSNGGSTIKHDIHVEDDKVTVEEDVYFTNKIAIELNTKIYLPPKTQASPKINLPPSFYKLTTAELKQIIDSQRSKIELNESRPLMTQKMREKEELLKAKKYPKTMIRVKFPSQIIIEMCFYSGAKVQLLFNEIRKFVEHVGNDGNRKTGDDSKAAFRLFISPPQKDLDPALSFWKQNLSPASIVYFLSDGMELRKDIAEKAIEYPSVEDQTVVGDEMEVEEEVLVEDYRPPQPTQAIETVQPKKLPKWLKLAK